MDEAVGEEIGAAGESGVALEDVLPSETDAPDEAAEAVDEWLVRVVNRVSCCMERTVEDDGKKEAVLDLKMRRRPLAVLQLDEAANRRPVGLPVEAVDSWPDTCLAGNRCLVHQLPFAVNWRTQIEVADLNVLLLSHHWTAETNNK